MKRYTQRQIDELANILKNDGVISVPTDTVYGLCARANSLKAYEKLMKIKNRPTNKLFPIMCADEEQIKRIAIVNNQVENLIHAFMPGPVTLVLNKKPESITYTNDIESNISIKIAIKTDTLAIRMATSKVLQELIYKVGNPIFMTSANQSGKEVCSNLDEIEKACPDLDGMMEGNVSFGKESTIIDCTSEKMKIQRQGVISIEQITEVLKNS